MNKQVSSPGVRRGRVRFSCSGAAAWKPAAPAKFGTLRGLPAGAGFDEAWLEALKLQEDFLQLLAPWQHRLLYKKVMNPVRTDFSLFFSSLIHQ